MTSLNFVDKYYGYIIDIVLAHDMCR